MLTNTKNLDTNELVKSITVLNNIESLKYMLTKFIEQNPDTKHTFKKFDDFIKSEIGEGDYSGIDKQYSDLLDELEEEVNNFLDMVQNDMHAEVCGDEFDEIEKKLLALLKKNKVKTNNKILNALQKIYRKMDYLDLDDDMFPKLSIKYLTK